MFDTLTHQMVNTFKAITGQARLTEENMQLTLSNIRRSLLEADVALPVIKQFIEAIKAEVLGQKIIGKLNAEQALVKIVYNKLVDILGESQIPLNLKTQPPAVILMAGLQGSGKTTTAAKLAYFLKEKEKKSVLLVSVDVYRPAAIEQLQLLAKQIGVDFYETDKNLSPLDRVSQVREYAVKQHIEVIIVDTAGRLHLDELMMTEIKQLHQYLNPIETLFIIDSMTGQDAVNTASAFDKALDLTGVILTKTDGDARGGAALSVKYMINKPIKFIGLGEAIGALESFEPKRIATSILGMGDIRSIIDKIDKESNEQLAKKIKKSKFDLEDFKQQILQINRMGGISSLVKKLPGMSGLSAGAVNPINDKSINKTVAIINSMTNIEKQRPDVINGSRKRRIAQGSGTTIQEINGLLKKHRDMQKMMQKLTKGGAKNMMRSFRGIPGMQQMLPPDLNNFEE